jgi:uncharacterized heparinase superfamily protein
MFIWIKAMCHPDGEISFFNDAAFGISPSVKEIEEYGLRLNLLKSMTDTSEKQYFKKLAYSGFTRVVFNELVALIDRSSVGPDYLPAHAHADTFSFELSYLDKRVIVNSGTSIYGESEERLRQKGTESHSTVMIDGMNSSEVWGGFRVARRAKVFKCKEQQQNNNITLSAFHNGYHRIKGKPTHFRKWQFSNQLLLVEDLITGKGEHEVDVIFLLHPQINIFETNNNKIILNVFGKKVNLNFEGKGFLEVEKSSYHPEFGISIENFKIHYRITEALPIKVTTRISW